MDHPFARERALFPLLAHKAQLSSCSQSALATPVNEALQAYLSSWREKGMDWGGWQQVLDQAKAEFARAIGAQASDIAVMSSVSDLVSSLAHSLDWGGGRDRVVLTDVDFPTVGHVWLAQQARGADIRFIDADADGVIALDAYRQALDSSTRLVSISQVSYGNAFRQDVAAIARITHEHGALLLVDAYQSAGSMVIDVVRDGIDVLVSGAQKYLLGCPGIAFMYVRPSLAAQLRPPTTGWFGRVNPFAFDIRTLDYADGARRFETGTPPYINAFAARAGMALLNQVGIDRVEAWLAHLSAVALREADRHGLSVASPRDPALKGAATAIRVNDSAAVERRMAEAGYVVSARGAVIRVAPHFYSTEDDVAGAIAALARLR